MKEFFEKHVTKKDLIYVMLLIITLLIISLLRGQLNSSEVVNVISIGAGLTSIFLAMAAIVYSFIQSSEASRQNHSVQEALNKITDKVEEVALIKQELQSFREDSRQNTQSIVQLLNLVGELKEIAAPISNSKPEELNSVVEKQMPLFNRKIKEIEETVYTLEGVLEQEVVNYINNHVAINQTFKIYSVMQYLRANNVEYSFGELSKTLSKIAKMKMIERINSELYRKIAYFEIKGQ